MLFMDYNFGCKQWHISSSLYNIYICIDLSIHGILFFILCLMSLIPWLTVTVVSAFCTGSGEHIIRTVLARECAMSIQRENNASLGLSQGFKQSLLGQQIQQKDIKTKRFIFNYTRAEFIKCQSGAVSGLQTEYHVSRYFSRIHK